MSWKFCQELDDFLSNEWIKVVDICAIFAGWIPISEYIPDYSSDPKYSPRSYLRLEDGKRVTPGKEGFKEIIRIQNKWRGSSWNYTTRYANVIDHDPFNEEIRVRDAFKIGLAMRVDRVALIYDTAVDQGIIVDFVPAPKTVQVSGAEIEIEEPEREKGYTPILLKTGKELMADGIVVNVGTVIDRWKDNPPDDIKDTTDDHFYYRHVDGHWNKVETKNLKRTIGRYFKKPDT